MTGGWCYGGFKATHPLNAAFTLERFAEGRTIDEKGAGPCPWAH